MVFLIREFDFRSAGENQKSHEVQGLENAPENERRTASIRLLAT
jgi:hypothetical protein